MRTKEYESVTDHHVTYTYAYQLIMTVDPKSQGGSDSLLSITQNTTSPLIFDLSTATPSERCLYPMQMSDCSSFHSASIVTGLLSSTYNITSFYSLFCSCPCQDRTLKLSVCTLCSRVFMVVTCVVTCLLLCFIPLTNL